MFKKTYFYSGYIIALTTAISLYFLSKATEGSEEFQKLHKPLLWSIYAGIIVLFIIVSSFLFRTIIHRKKQVPGASLSLSIILKTILSMGFPIILIAFFAFKFLQYEFQSSFDKGINDALTNSLILSEQSLNNRGLLALKETKNIADRLANLEYNELRFSLESFREQANIEELTVFDEKGFIQAIAAKNHKTIIPLIPKHNDFLSVNSNQGIYSINKQEDNLLIYVLTNINKPGIPNYYLQAVFSVPNMVSKLTNQVEKTVKERDQFNYIMPQVNQSFIFVLVLVVLLSVLLLILISMNIASQMAKPIQSLIKGTKNISEGNFDKKLLLSKKDKKNDFGTLVNSFNEMTRSLKQAKKEIEENKNQVESEHAYLSTVINHITSAVITLDIDLKLLTYNDKAQELLSINLDEAIYIPKEAISLSLNPLKQLTNQLSQLINLNQTEAELQIEVNHQKKEFMVKITALPFTETINGGYVVIFEAMGEYLQKQKQAAWEEVSRRLAHEVKNPLTPILLAAERLNYKLSNSLKDEEKGLLERSTSVIVAQVKSLENMVNDFTNYAKPQTNKKQPISLHKVLEQVFNLYKDHYENISFYLDLRATNDIIQASNNALRQILHNLIKNAIEAIETKQQGMVCISTENIDNKIQLQITDNGSGLNHNEKVFDPYVTTKEKGTGLGLAIVEKIIKEHQATVDLFNNKNRSGATAQIKFDIINK